MVSQNDSSNIDGNTNSANTKPKDGFIILMDAENDHVYALRVDAERGRILEPLEFDAEANRIEGSVHKRLAFDRNYSFDVAESGIDGRLSAKICYLNGAEVVAKDVHYQWKLSVENVEGKDVYNASFEIEKDSIVALKRAGFPIMPPQNYELKNVGEVNSKKPVHLFFPPHHPEAGQAVIDYLTPLDMRAMLELVSEQEEVHQAADIKSDVVKASAKPQYKISDEDLERNIKKFCTDMTAQAAGGQFDPVSNAEEDIRFIFETLSSYNKGWVCLTGDGGVGKSARAKAIAQEIADRSDNVPVKFRNAMVLSIDFTAMETGKVGELAANVRTLTEGLMERKGMFKGRRVIPFIDKIHKQVATGGTTAAGAAASVLNMLDEFLDDHNICGMAETTTEEYNQVFPEGSPLQRRLPKYIVLPPDTKTTKAILLDRYNKIYKGHYGFTKEIGHDLLDTIINRMDRLMPNRAQPDKSLDALDRACNKSMLAGYDHVDREITFEAIGETCGFSKEFLKKSDSERLMYLKEELPKRILGQDAAMAMITDKLIDRAAGLGNKERPRGAFIFQGPTRTGKTETARQVAEILFGKKTAMLKLDMSEYMEPLSVSKLLGAPPGYVGYEEGGHLTEPIRQNPFTIILLDEIEKAHPKVFDILLQILDEGQILDQKGKVISFKNTIIMMSSNAGARENMAVLKGQNKSAGFGSNNINFKKLQEKLTTNSDAALTELFRPELRNRINSLGGVVPFIPLTRDVIRQLIVRQVETIEKDLNDAGGTGLKNVKLAVAPEYIDKLLNDNYNMAFNAGVVENLSNKNLITPITKWLLKDNNIQRVQDFVAENGSAQIYLQNEKTEPVLRKVPKVDLSAAFGNANDNKPTAKPKVEFGPAAPARHARNSGPKR